MTCPKHLVLVVGVLSLLCACSDQNTHPASKGAPVTLPKEVAGVFGKSVQGICTPNATRASLKCDIYNGSNWTITEVTFVVTWSPHEDDDMRLYRVPASIEPQTTKTLSFSLGIDLPADTVIPLRGRPAAVIGRWGWSIDSAKGYRSGHP
jgi:hypothetical protein